MTSAAVLEQLDVPARRAQHAKFRRGDLGLVDHQRVELVRRETLPVRLHDHDASVIAEPAPAAFSAEEVDQLAALQLILSSLVRAKRGDVLRTLPSEILPVARGGQMTWCHPPMDDR